MFIESQKKYIFHFQIYHLEKRELKGAKCRKSRVNELKKWRENGGVMILGYEMFRKLATFEGIKYKPWKETMRRALLDPGKLYLIFCIYNENKIW